MLAYCLFGKSRDRELSPHVLGFLARPSYIPERGRPVAMVRNTSLAASKWSVKFPYFYSLWTHLIINILRSAFLGYWLDSSLT